MRSRTNPTSRRHLMRGALVALAAALLAPSLALSAGYRDEVLADSPATYWRLGEAAGTSAANEIAGNTGTYAGGVLLAQPSALSGDPNFAATFDGVNDAVTVPANATLDATTGVTVELWAKRTKNASWQVLVGKPGNGQSRLENYAIWIDSSNRVQAYFGNGTTYVSAAWGTAIDTGWHHIAATYDNQIARLYVDGVQRVQTSSTVQLTPNPNPLNIGRANDGAYPFGGSLDEVAIYRAALPAARIQAHYASAGTSPGGDTTPPVVTLTQPANGATVTTATPALGGVAGTATEDSTTVTVRLYAGTSATGSPVQTLVTTRGAGGSYSVNAATLANGTYTGRAEQADAAGNLGQSATTTFTVATGPGDVTPPVVSLTQPASGANLALTTPTFAGTAGTLVGDSATVTVLVYGGTTATGTPVQTLTTTRGLTGDFSVAASPALTNGTYTARADQSDDAGNVGQSATRTFTIDTVAPSVTLSQPANGSTVTIATPTLAGTGGTATGDSTTVSISLYTGSTATGTPVQTLSAARQAGGAFSTTPAALSNGTYTARASQSDATGNVGTSGTVTFVVAVATGSDPVMIGAGDIAGCGTTPKDAETAAILAANPTATVFTLGDNAYDNGTLTEFNNCYGPTWGAHKARTRPTVADHELDTGSPNGYLTYFNAQLAPFGPTATDPTKMYYSYNIGAWHVVHLNAACFYYTPGCNVAGQEAWFAADLAANPNQCTAVMLHAPRFSSGNIHGSNTDMQGLWSAAYDGGVDIVLSGDDHIYERFAPMDAAGNADPTFGVRQFIAGTGGYLMYGIGTVKPNSQVRYTANPGVMKLTLHPTSYDWQFIPINGLPSPDSGTANCHGVPGSGGGGGGVPGAPAVRATQTASANYASTALTISTPAGTVAGDVLLATIAHQGGSIRTLTAPAGWTSVPGADATDGSNVRIRAFWKAAGASEPASHTFTLTGGSGMALSGGIMALTGANTTNPINAAAAQATTSNASTLVAPSITTTVASTRLVYAGGINAPLTYVAPPGMTEHWDVTTSGSYNAATSTASAGFAGPGATGTRAATLSQTARGAALLIAIAPAGG